MKYYIKGVDMGSGPPCSGVTYWLGDQQITLHHRFTGKRRCKACGALRSRTKRAKRYPYCSRCVS